MARGFASAALLASWFCGAALYAQEPPEPTDAAVLEPESHLSLIAEGAPPEPVEEALMPETATTEALSTDLPTLEIPQGEASKDDVEADDALVPPDESPVDDSQPGAALKEGDPALERLRRTAPRDLLEIAGIDASQLRPLYDGWPLGDNELEITLKLLYRVRRFGQVDTTLWSQPIVPLAAMAKSPRDYRLQMFALRGRVVQVSVENPPPEMIERYDFDKFYACLVELEGSQHPVLVVTPTIPGKWDLTQPIDEPVSAQGLFVKAGERRGDLIQLVFLASRLAWHPDQAASAATAVGINPGLAELGRLGMDLGLFDGVQNRERITDRDREAFYQLLAAVGRAPQNQLARIAKANLPRMREHWRDEIGDGAKELVELREALQGFQGPAEERDALSQRVEETNRRLSVLQRAEKDAGEGRYSVYPLFNLSDEQHGQLVFLEGVARRVMKVEVANPRNPDSNRDILTRFGIDHYYEIAIFTKDSTDNPLIVCARELPAGFPQGSNVNQAVQIAGFFFKTWAYFTTEGVHATGQEPPAARRQLAPLLIARAPIWVKDPPLPDSRGVAATIGAIFLGLMVLASFSVWMFNRKDEQFRKNVMVRKYEPEQGTSLDDVGLITVDGPDFRYLNEQAQDAGDAISPSAGSPSENRPEEPASS